MIVIALHLGEEQLIQALLVAAWLRRALGSGG